MYIVHNCVRIVSFDFFLMYKLCFVEKNLQVSILRNLSIFCHDIIQIYYNHIFCLAILIIKNTNRIILYYLY